jgi:hypothetical protein
MRYFIIFLSRMEPFLHPSPGAPKRFLWNPETAILISFPRVAFLGHLSCSIES